MVVRSPACGQEEEIVWLLREGSGFAGKGRALTRRNVAGEKAGEVPGPVLLTRSQSKIKSP